MTVVYDSSSYLEEFLHRTKPDLHTMYCVKRANHRAGQRANNPTKKIRTYISELEEIFLSPGQNHDSIKENNSRKDKRRQELYKNFIYSSCISKKDDIPDSYFANQIEVLRQQGHGRIQLTLEQKEEMAHAIVSEQKTSLDAWLSYLTSDDSQNLNPALKYWAFCGVTKLSKFDKEKGKFNKRNKQTVAPFPELNSEALTLIVESLDKKLSGKDNYDNDEKFQKLLEEGNFGKLYSYAIQRIGVMDKTVL
jgi:hypothetical protein